MDVQRSSAKNFFFRRSSVARLASRANLFASRSVQTLTAFIPTFAVAVRLTPVLKLRRSTALTSPVTTFTPPPQEQTRKLPLFRTSLTPSETNVLS